MSTVVVDFGWMLSLVDMIGTVVPFVFAVIEAVQFAFSVRRMSDFCLTCCTELCCFLPLCFPRGSSGSGCDMVSTALFVVDVDRSDCSASYFDDTAAVDAGLVDDKAVVAFPVVLDSYKSVDLAAQDFVQGFAFLSEQEVSDSPLCFVVLPSELQLNCWHGPDDLFGLSFVAGLAAFALLVGCV